MGGGDYINTLIYSVMYNVENNLCYYENYFNIPYDSAHIIKAVKMRLII